MKHYVGLDVAMKETAICIVDDQRGIVREGKAATEPEAFARLRGLRPARLVILGSGKDAATTEAAHAALLQTAVALGVGDDIALPGSSAIHSRSWPGRRSLFSRLATKVCPPS
jgi:hypothetical protein